MSDPHSSVAPDGPNQGGKAGDDRGNADEGRLSEGDHCRLLHGTRMFYIRSGMSSKIRISRTQAGIHACPP